MDEQLYKFIDSSGKCFDEYAKIEDPTDYHVLVALMLKNSQEGKKTFGVGDMLCFRDELQDAGFKWGTDFFIKKITE